ncbi:hypothetical protein AJ79_03358 [Helicocarpus griseus UAMH5409]|uniref:Uncharacterized protein n=1 Tax=Helicocarpus griseus UAMH5409 TaxID=1447875 RepID=A0A2B7XYT9_9EURO|nr:hypothetical protein AJ79_03358 [Helicocarpus griseus UAMH5409]
MKQKARRLKVQGASASLPQIGPMCLGTGLGNYAVWCTWLIGRPKNISTTSLYDCMRRHAKSLTAEWVTSLTSAP